MNLSEIELSAKHFADAHAALSEEVLALNEKINALKRAALPGIKKAVERAAERKSVLAEKITEGKGLFTKPRTVIFHGIKLGLQKKVGGLFFSDADKVVSLIKKHFSKDEAATLLHITETPDKEALNKLPVCDLKKIGVEVLADADAVVIKPAASEVEKIVAAFLKDALDVEQS